MDTLLESLRVGRYLFIQENTRSGLLLDQDTYRQFLALIKAATVLTEIGWAEVQFYVASEKVVEIICKIN